MLKFFNGVMLGDVTLGSLTLTTGELALYSALCLTALILVAVIVALIVKRAKKKSNSKQVVEPVVVDEAQKVETQPEQQPTQEATNEQASQEASVAKTKQTTPTVQAISKVQVVATTAAKPVSEDTDVVVRGKVQIIYNKSLTAKLCQADDEVKGYYDELKTELLSYKGVKNRISWKHESFRKGRVLLAKLRIRGKKLCIYLPLNAKDYEDSKYKVVDVGDVKANEETPCAYMIKNDRRARYAKELIAVAMGKLGLEQGEVVETKHSDSFPYDTTESLIRRKLIKLVYSKSGEGGGNVQYITAEEVGLLMTDEEAQQSVEESSRVADKTKTGIVNVDLLSLNFEPGDRVTLEEIKKRVPGFNKKVTYVKVLARGVIDKPLTVEADDFSIDAVKMIVLTGGTVIRTKKQ